MSQNEYLQALRSKLDKKTAVIGIIGLGYVGLPLLLRFCKEKFHVIGFDVDDSKVNILNAGKSFIQHISDEDVSCAKPYFQVTSDYSQIREVDAIILCVPTPLTRHRDPDLSYVTQTVDSCLPYLRPGQLMSLESTTYPGTTEEILKPSIESAELKVGENFFLVYSPEREDPGNAKFHTAVIPKVCGGVSQDCLAAGVALYSCVIKKVVPVSSPGTAEMTKLLENIHRAVNIGLVNEMKVVADSMGIDIHEVVDAAATKPFGFVPYYPGPGIGGHCIPIDPFYLTWKAREFGIHTRFIELAGEVNNYMPHWVLSKTLQGLNDRGIAISQAKILVLGAAYKNDVDDMRESPSLTVMSLLLKMQAEVDYSDPYVPVLPKTRGHDFNDCTMKSVSVTEDSLKQYDCVIIATAHKCFDYDLIKQASSLIVDTRGVYRKPAAHIIKA